MDYCWQLARHREVREMGWSLFGPAIFTRSLEEMETPWRIHEDEEALWILKSLEKNPEPLKAFLYSRGDKRLGARFEALWHYFFEQHSFYRILASNFQIGDKSRTFGSLDFLIEDSHCREIIHLELAVKFYLFMSTAPGTGLEKWIGPNPDDTLGTKLDHLMGHQLPLTTTETARAALKSRGLPIPEKHVAIVKGCLFHPARSALKTPPPVNPDHPRGEWLRLSAIDTVGQAFADARFGIVDKTLWLDPAPRLDLDFQTLSRHASLHLQTSPHPLMIQVEHETASRRFFIVPDQWPINLRADYPPP